MYNDNAEYIQFLLQNKILISKEQVGRDNNVENNVINTDLDWRSIAEEYETNRVVVVDNFLKESVALRLRDFFLFVNLREDIYSDYAAINFYRNIPGRLWFPLLTSITEECKTKIPFLKNTEFERAWAFIYNNTSNGVPTHADPAATNLNLWVTPDDCMNLEDGKNGLDVWKVYPPESWSYEKYNGDDDAIKDFLLNKNSSKMNVSYKFNRVTIFDSRLFHKTQPVSSKPGYANRRINYTFLYS